MLLLSSPILLLLLLLLLPVPSVVTTVHGHTVTLLLRVAAVILHILRGSRKLRRPEYVSAMRLLVASLLIALLLPGCSL